MKRIPLFIIMLIFSLAMFSGCEKSSENCLSNTGKIIRQVRFLEPFDSISMNDNVNVILSYDSICGVTVEAGEHIIDGIKTEVSDGNLIIHNNNICNWTRDYSKPINVYISSDYLWKIRYNSSGDLTSATILPYDSLKVEVWGGCGTIELSLNIVQGYFSENLGTADFRLHGSCGICNIYSGEYGPFHCEDLDISYCFITSSGSNDCWVNARRILGATITSIGNVYYTGQPDSVYSHITGEGRLIHY